MTTFLFSWAGMMTAILAQGPSGFADTVEPMGAHRLTVYWLARETRRDRNVEVRSVRLRLRGTRKTFVRVSRRFARDLLMQGSGFLFNKTLIQYAGRCGRLSRLRCMKIVVLNRRRFPMSRGALGRALIPFRSLAVDSRSIPLGSRVYIPKLGKLLRLGGYRHNGCFIAHDRGGRILGNRIDLFVGLPHLFYRRLGRRMPRRAKLFLNHPSCK